jgi:hypothetical protein
MRELGIDVLFTCFPEAEIEKVYPTEKLPGLIKINTLTGYVPYYLSENEPDFDRKRPIDVGYRGRGVGFWWLGSLYQEKSLIAKEFLRYVQHTELKLDISSKEKDRIYGKKYFQFLKNCRCTLGTESGANVIDFTGEIEKNVRRYCLKHPEASFDEVKNLFFKDIDGKIKMNQISPRCFEAIGCGCCLILFEGEYSGILKRNIHYIELKKDFSNIEEVVEKIRNKYFIREMAERAYEDIIASGKYSYKTFVAAFDSHLDGIVTSRPKSLSSDVETQTLRPLGPLNQSIASYSTSEDDCVGSQDLDHHLFPALNRQIMRALRTVVRIIRVGGYIIRSVHYKTKSLLSFLYYKIKFFMNLLLQRMKHLYLYHPFFLVQKFRLIMRIIKDLGRT